MKWRTVIVEDEVLALRKLKGFVIRSERLELVGEAGDAVSALATIEASKPDLLFLDVQLPGSSGLDLLRQLRHRPSIIFTTAYDQFAVTAFELDAIDYLVKPFGESRFEQAVARLDERRHDGSLPAPTKPIDRLFVRERGRIVPLPIAQVESIRAEREYAAISTGAKTFLIRIALDQLEQRLDERFERVHRSYIVNLDHVTVLEPLEGSRLQARLRSGATVPVSRERSKALRMRVI